MHWRETVLLCTTVVALSACGAPGSTGQPQARDFGQHALDTLDTECGGVSGLTGASILAQRTETIQAQLSYVTAQGSRVDPTALTIDLTWPANPVATCYPPYQANGTVIAQDRLAIEGVAVRFHTADGKFDETLTGKAWRVVLNGNPQGPQLLAVTSRTALHGTWQPFAEYQQAGNTVSFFNSLAGASSAQAGGNVGLGGEDPEELNAGIFRGRFAVAIWP